MSGSFDSRWRTGVAPSSVHCANKTKLDGDLSRDIFRPMLDHISLRVNDFDRAIAFYKAALAPIGYSVVMEFPDVAGLGEPGKPDLWVMKSGNAVNPTHLAFRATRAAVDAFHAAALAAGATDNGPPGLRLEYHPNYYGAFVLDPEGNNIEVVCHEPPGAAKRAVARASAAKRKPAAKSKKSAKGKGASKSAGKKPKGKKRR
jgi:catechol 2,3-dioxygenase-like lactoylglutathione lyase family enzyme